MKRIRLTFKDGQAQIQAIGFQGPACLAATKGFERALGTVTSDVKTAEYRQAEHAVDADRLSER